MLGGATDPATSSLVPFSWTCLIVGGLGCFFLLPEFFAYLSLRDTFEEICALDSRTEVIRRRKEAEDAAEALGAGYRSRLLGVYRNLEIKPNRRWSERPRNITHSISWWSNPRSKISVILPRLNALKKIEIHRALISLTSLLLAIIVFESVFGGFDASSRSLNDMIIGNPVQNHPPPHIDSVSAVIALALAILLWMTTLLIPSKGMWIEMASSIIREAMISISLVVIILSGLWAITGSWPPLVVVESNSMIHSEDGEIGAIDAGDLILVTAPERAARIITFAESIQDGNPHNGHESHGMPGDVIIYKKNGGNDTPVIHRAILRNESKTNLVDGTYPALI